MDKFKYTFTWRETICIIGACLCGISVIDGLFINHDLAFSSGAFIFGALMIAIAILIGGEK